MLYAICKVKEKVRFKIYSRRRDLEKLYEFLKKVDDAVAPSVFKDFMRVLEGVLNDVNQENSK